MQKSMIKFIFAIVLMSIFALAQDPAPEQPQQPAADQPAEETPEGDGTAPPTSMFGELLDGSWRLLGTVSAGTSYTDNAFLGGTPKRGSSTSTLEARIGFGVARRRLNFQAFYLPGYTFDTEFDQLNSPHHGYAQTLQWSKSARTKVNWGVGMNWFESQNANPLQLVSDGESTTPVFDYSQLQPGTRTFSLNSTVGVSHRASARTDWNFTGSMTFVDAEQLGTGFDQQSVSGTGGVQWTYRVNSRRRFGVAYRHTYTNFLSQDANSNYDSFQLTFSQGLGRRFTFTAGVGPGIQKHSTSSDIKPQLSVNTGLNYRASRTSVSIGFTRGGELALFQNALASYQAHLGVNHRLGRHWNTGGNFTFTRGTDLFGLVQSDGFGGGLFLSRNFGRNFTASGRYSVTHVESPVPLRTYTRNRYSFNIGYNFGQLLQR